MLRDIDIALFKLANAFHTPVWDALMVAGSQFGLYNGWMVAMPVVLVLLAVRLAAQPRAYWFRASVPYITALLCLAIGYWLVIPLVEAIKDIVNSPRPYALLPAGEVVRVDAQLSAHSAMRSFPSGHSAVAATLAVAASALPLLLMRRAILLLALWIAFSRLSLGVHFPSDVVGGMAIAIVCTLPVRMGMERLSKAYFGN